MIEPYVTILRWASGLSALLALVVYFYVLAKRPQWVRLINGSGLFFTGLALALVAHLLPGAAARGDIFNNAVAAVSCALPSSPQRRPSACGGRARKTSLRSASSCRRRPSSDQSTPPNARLPWPVR